MKSHPVVCRLLAGLFVAALAGCVVNLAFDMPQDLQIDGTGGTLNGTFNFDLSQYPEVTQHSSNVQSLSFQSLDATVTTVKSGNTATSISGTLALRPGGATDSSQDVKVGTISNLAITQGQTFHLQGSPALDTFLLSTVKGNGKFSLVISNGVVTGGDVHLVLHVVVHADLGYGTGVF
jgi:hypothetical protein